MLITGRLSVGKPEDESDERWTRASLGSIVIAFGGVSLMIPELPIRVLALALLVGGVVLLSSAFLWAFVAIATNISGFPVRMRHG